LISLSNYDIIFHYTKDCRDSCGQFYNGRMSLKDIREYIHLAMEGDSTIEERLQLFYRQRQILQAQMEELQHTMDVLDFKCWYYETARDAGTVQVPQSMSVEELPPQFRNLKRDLAKVPIVD
jgi:DNA-binding transcriptional MerR regulator